MNPRLPTLTFPTRALTALAFLALATLLPAAARAADPIDIGDRLEPFVDLHIVDKLDGVTHKFHSPVEITPAEQAPSDGYYATVIYLPEQKKYLHYCREVLPGYEGARDDGHAGEVTTLEESTDGVHWTKPKLGIFEFNGSKDNNYILHGMSPFSHNFSPFLDANPACPPEQRFKALAGTLNSGLVAFVSADGVHWKKLREEAVIPTKPDTMMFDSQNVAFWSPVEKQYVAYCRLFADKLRKVMRFTSPDFLTWTGPVLQPANMPEEQLYTSQAHPYFRAPHIVVGLATRFFPTVGQSTDISLITTRDGKNFDRVLKEAFIRPAPLRKSWANRGNFAALNVYPLKNTTPEDVPEDWRYKLPKQMAIMVRDRIYALRIDGFASIHAGFEPGTMVTKPLVFEGDELRVNYETSAAGSIQVEILDADGQPIPGYSRADSKDRLWGNQIEERAQWKEAGTNVGPLAGKPVRLKFFMREADLYAIKFQKAPK
jgi:hypothetical protein